MERSNIAIVIPAFNEAETICRVIHETEEYGDIIVVDDFSDDGTREQVKKTDAFLVSHESNLGYEAALASGIKYASDNDYIFIVTTDADGELANKGIKKIIEFLEKDYSLVIGKRNKKNRAIEHLFGMISSFVFKIQDPLCGMKGYNSDMYKKYGFFDKNKMIGTELLAYALRDNLPIKEVSINVFKRKSKSRFGGSLYSLIRITRVIFLFFRIALKKKID